MVQVVAELVIILLVAEAPLVQQTQEEGEVAVVMMELPGLAVLV